MKKNRAYYQKLFQDYPDLVTQAQLRQMLNGISISFSSFKQTDPRKKSAVIFYKTVLLHCEGQCDRLRSQR